MPASRRPRDTRASGGWRTGVRPGAARPAGPGGGRRNGLPPAVRLIFVGVFIYLVVGFGLQELEVLRLANQVRALEERVVELREANDRLRQEIEYAKTDAYIIEVAREQLGLVWPNEIPYASGTASGP